MGLPDYAAWRVKRWKVFPTMQHIEMLEGRLRAEYNDQGWVKAEEWLCIRLAEWQWAEGFTSD